MGEITVTLTRQQVAEVAIASYEAAVDSFAANKWDRASRYFRAASECCAALDSAQSRPKDD
jgi:hypothetical protein